MAYTLAGSTTHFSVYYDNSLGAYGIALSSGLLAACEGNYTDLASLFGVACSPLPITCYVDPGTQGATNFVLTNQMFLRPGPQTDLSTNITFLLYLFVSELSEFFTFARFGFDLSTGTDAISKNESVSRICASRAYPTAAPAGSGFATGSSWLNSPRADYVSANAAYPATGLIPIGCGVIFINYLQVQLGIPLSLIVQNTSATLDLLYSAITGYETGTIFRLFAAIVASAYPVSVAVVYVVDDNPFPLPSSAGGAFNWRPPAESPDGIRTSFTFASRPRQCLWNGLIQLPGFGFWLGYTSQTDHTVSFLDNSRSIIAPASGEILRGAT